jgi:Predicted acyltransferase
VRPLFAEKFNREIRIVRAPEPHRETAEHLSASLEKAGESGVRVDYNTAGALLSFDLLKALREGEIVSIQGDRVEGDVAQINAQIFNAQAKIPNGPFVLALVAEVPIYPSSSRALAVAVTR